MKRLIQVVTIFAALCAGFLVLAGGSVAAQAQHVSDQRVVQGTVQDKAGAPVQGATVFLKDSHTMAVKSFLTDAKGNFHIGQLSPNGDYELWAELNGKKSASRSISSFDTKKEITVSFKVDR